jgi:Zn-dependent peptidase ImmA (M78 family)
VLGLLGGVPRLDHLYRHAADEQIDVTHTDLGPVLRGCFVARLNKIVLNTRLTRAQMTAALAHELGHAAFGDDCSTDANERRADEYGARLAITRREFRRAERLVGPDDESMAAELEVTGDLIRAWRRGYLRRAG